MCVYRGLRPRIRGNLVWEGSLACAAEPPPLQVVHGPLRVAGPGAARCVECCGRVLQQLREGVDGVATPRAWGSLQRAGHDMRAFWHRKSRTVCKSNLQPDFNVRVFECFDTSTSAVLRELAESNRFVQKSAESTSI